METNETQPTPSNPLHEPKVIRSLAVWAVALALLIVVGVIALFHEPEESPTGGTPGYSIQNVETCEAGESDELGINGRIGNGWILVGGGDKSIAVPQSAKHGPFITDAEGPSCYTRSPGGAVFAAANILALDNTGKSEFLVRELTVEGDARDKLLATTGEGEPLRGAEIVAFDLVHYSKDTATVDVVIEYNSVYVAVLVDVVHDGGDWKWNPPSSLELPMERLEDLDGHTRFGEK